MRKLWLLLLVVALVPLQAHAEDKPALGTIASSGSSTNNLTTASTFTITAGARLAIQCDAAAYVIAGTSGSSLTVSSSTGEKVSADQWWPLGPPNSAVNAVAIIPVSGSANCKVFQVYDPVNG